MNTFADSTSTLHQNEFWKRGEFFLTQVLSSTDLSDFDQRGADRYFRILIARKQEEKERVTQSKRRAYRRFLGPIALGASCRNDDNARARSHQTSHS